MVAPQRQGQAPRAEMLDESITRKSISATGKIYGQPLQNEAIEMPSEQEIERINAHITACRPKIEAFAVTIFVQIEQRSGDQRGSKRTIQKHPS